jgi:hypothetical protein
MAVVLHGTTRWRAEQIFARGPDPDFIEPGAGPQADPFQEFSTCLESGPFPFGTPQEYARRKAAMFPGEGGPAILAVDVPDEIIALAVDEEYFPLSQGVVQFDRGAGLDALRAAWSGLPKQIRSVEGP